MNTACALCGRIRPAPLFRVAMDGKEFPVHNMRKVPGLDCADRIRETAPEGAKIKIFASDELKRMRQEQELRSFWKDRGLDPEKLFPKKNQAANGK